MASVAAPSDASSKSGYVGTLSDALICPASMSNAISCGPVWEFADWIHYSFTRLASALPFPGSSSPVSPTVVPYPASTAYVPDASDRSLGLHRDSCRSSVIFILGEQRPDHARHLAS
jgi:hypothetical protein